MANYIALIHKDHDSDYGVSFPDLPGCIAVGQDLDEARAMAEEALALHIEGMIEDGEAVPEPASLEDVMRDADNQDGVAVLVRAPARQKAVRINITLPEDLLRDIDRYAEIKGMSRSGFLAKASRDELDSEYQTA